MCLQDLWRGGQRSEAEIETEPFGVCAHVLAYVRGSNAHVIVRKSQTQLNNEWLINDYSAQRASCCPMA